MATLNKKCVAYRYQAIVLGLILPIVSATTMLIRTNPNPLKSSCSVEVWDHLCLHISPILYYIYTLANMPSTYQCMPPVCRTLCINYVAYERVNTGVYFQYSAPSFNFIHDWILTKYWIRRLFFSFVNAVCSVLHLCFNYLQKTVVNSIIIYTLLCSCHLKLRGFHIPSIGIWSEIQNITQAYITSQIHTIAVIIGYDHTCYQWRHTRVAPWHMMGEQRRSDIIKQKWTNQRIPPLNSLRWGKIFRSVLKVIYETNQPTNSHCFCFVQLGPCLLKT